MGALAKEHPWEYLAASACAATINYPLWRASAVGQSGFQVVGLTGVPHGLRPYCYAFLPPYKGMIATILGMTWARGAIFWGSDYGRHYLQSRNFSQASSILLPPLVVSTVVQCVNMPLVRATITLQNPQSNLANVTASIRHIFQTHGLAGLWHGTSAGILKSVPKYCTAVVVKDVMEAWLPKADPSVPTYHQDMLLRAAVKSMTAGVAGAALTNPLDVIRNEMFKTNLGLLSTVQHLRQETRYGFLTRGLGKNMIAVAIPIACTLFFTDAFIYLSQQRHSSSASNPNTEQSH